MPTQPLLNEFYPNQREPGIYWTWDGFKADLDWNPLEQLQRKAKRIKAPPSSPKVRGWEERMIFAEQETDIDGPEIRLLPRCLWCNKEQETYDLQASICLTCLYPVCFSCGKTYHASSPKSRTCSSECSNILRGERGRWLVLERDDFTCIYCGKSSPHDATILHVDHIIPVVDGGKSHAANLITSCKICNMEKSRRRMSGKNEAEILEIAQQRNQDRGIDNKRVLRIRESDIS